MSKYHLVVECPETGRAVRTGWVIDALGAFDTLPSVPQALRCPHCGREHLWSKLDAWLEGEAE